MKTQINKKDFRDAQNENAYYLELYKNSTTGNIEYRSPNGNIIKVADKNGIDSIENFISNLNLVDILVDSIGEHTSKAGITINNTIIQNKVAKAIDSTDTATPGNILGGLITSTSAAGTNITLPSGTHLGAACNAIRGTSFDLTVDNSAGAQKVTLIPGADCIASSWTNADDTLLAPLEIAAGATGVGIFRFTFTSATTCVFSRIG